MPARIETATIAQIDPNTLETDERYPDAYGFNIQLSRDPGPEWGAEFDAVYEALKLPGKPPVDFRGDSLRAFLLPRYASEASRFLRILEGVVAETNRAVDLRNSVLPDAEKEKEQLRDSLRQAAKEFNGRQETTVSKQQ